MFNNNSILDGWASYFESLSVPDSTPLTEDQNNVLASYLHSCSLPTDDPVLVEEEEVEAIVRSLPLRRAPGPDHITNEQLKFGSSNLFLLFFSIPSSCLGTYLCRSDMV